jgi:hypothetical protein
MLRAYSTVLWCLLCCSCMRGTPETTQEPTLRSMPAYPGHQLTALSCKALRRLLAALPTSPQQHRSQQHHLYSVITVIKPHYLSSVKALCHYHKQQQEHHHHHHHHSPPGTRCRATRCWSGVPPAPPGSWGGRQRGSRRSTAARPRQSRTGSTTGCCRWAWSAQAAQNSAAAAAAAAAASCWLNECATIQAQHPMPIC